MRVKRAIGSALLVTWLSNTIACQLTRNPSLSLTPEEIDARYEKLCASPARPVRPIVVVGGYRDPGLGPWWLRRNIARALDTEEITSVSFFFAWTFEGAREALIAHVDEAFPGADPVFTREVDVVAVSMGGVLARFAALERGGERRLRIARLFTVSTPHRGASLAPFAAWADPMVHDMLPGSPFLESLDKALAAHPYPVIPYTRLSDLIVGAENASPPGIAPLWTPASLFEPSHLCAPKDLAIITDLASRLRGEPSIFSEPRAPLPR